MHNVNMGLRAAASSLRLLVGSRKSGTCRGVHTGRLKTHAKGRKAFPFRSISSSSSSYHHDLATAILSDNENDDERETISESSLSLSYVDMKRRIALSKAITLIESQSPRHRDEADLLLNDLARMRIRSKSNNNEIDNSNRNDDDESTINDLKRRPFRVGITGPPGVGKSSFIEAFGKFLLDFETSKKGGKDKEDVEKIEYPDKLGVICIDPSSVISGGSILGDKTRMTELSRHPRAYVRPSPSKGVLGGLASYTDECCQLCEAAGYDLVLVETVGLGQSEVDVSQAVDMLILMVAPGGGDHLQGSKKGVLEVSDMLIVNKADGNLLQAARNTAMEYKAAIHMFRPRMVGWETPPVLLSSSSDDEFLLDTNPNNNRNEMFLQVWNEICRYRRVSIDGGTYDLKRQKQRQYWMWKQMQDLITSKVRTDENVRRVADDLEKELCDGSITPRAAAAKLLELSTDAIHDANRS